MGKLIIALLFPAIIAAIILWPPFAIGRFIFLRRNGEGDWYANFRRAWGIALGVASAFSYVFFIIGLFYTEVLPGWSEFLAKGTLGMLIVPSFVLNFIIGGVLSKSRALRMYRSSIPSRQMPPNG